MKPITIRRADREESDAVAALYHRVASREWDFLYPHTAEEVRLYFRDRVLVLGPVWLAELDGAPIGFVAVRRGWIDHLYVEHAHHGRGIGRALLDQALRGRRRVRLWTFQRNLRTRRFYARNGFVERLMTDGARNEEREPDVLLEWRRQGPVH